MVLCEPALMLLLNPELCIKCEVRHLQLGFPICFIFFISVSFTCFKFKGFIYLKAPPKVHVLFYPPHHALICFSMSSCPNMLFPLLYCIISQSFLFLFSSAPSLYFRQTELRSVGGVVLCASGSRSTLTAWLSLGDCRICLTFCWPGTYRRETRREEDCEPKIRLKQDH